LPYTAVFPVFRFAPNRDTILKKEAKEGSSMPKGYAGKFLFVNLSTGETREEAFADDFARSYIGGYGMGARILYDRQKPGADPLGPDNILGFLTGPLTGSPIPSGSRFVALAKSPLTGGWGDANCGGEFGPYLKFSGFDGVFFSGISDRPVYLLIDHGKAEIKSAEHLWGRDAYETEDALLAEYGKESRATCIGQAGEKLSLISAIMTDRGSAAGRSGLGAVMGSKRLKAVIARGNQPIGMADKAAADKLRLEHLKSLDAPGPGGESFLKNFHKYGTSGMTYQSAHSGDTPVKNWGGVGIRDLPDREGLQRDIVDSFVDRRFGCWHCPIACKASLKTGTGKYEYNARVRRPEYETLASFGANCANSDTESINKANDICNRYGLDTISAGTVVAFATELYENGILTGQDTGGIELRWGNHKAMVEMTELLGKREGIGNILADGVKAAAQRIGRGAEQFAVHVGGQEVGMHDPKLLSFGRGGPTAARYQMDATPGRHTQGFGPSGFRGHVINASGMCIIGFGFGGGPEKDQQLTDFLNSVTGLGFTPAEVLKAGERIANLRHCFNLREGIKELDWTVHPRIVGKPPQKEGPLAGVTNDIEAQVYWNLGALDWDRQTTKPSKKKLLELGLDDIAVQLWPAEKPAGPKTA
jgi:aldehyde:ferredoxin oxidoreductase